MVSDRPGGLLRTYFRLSCAAAIVLAVSGAAPGGTLATDGNAIMQGTETFSASIPGFPEFGSVEADVEYAVYSPGSFNSSFSGADPSGDSEYVYAYQMFNTGPMLLNQLTVGLDPGDPVTSIGVVDDPNGSAGVSPNPSGVSFQGTAPNFTSAKWTYNPNPGVPNGGKSQILIFTSPNSPEFDDVTVLAGAIADTRQLPSPSPSPSPIPEPSTFLLATLGLLGLLGFTRRRRK